MDGSRLLGQAQRPIAKWLEAEPEMGPRAETPSSAVQAIDLVLDTLNGHTRP